MTPTETLRKLLESATRGGIVGHNATVGLYHLAPTFAQEVLNLRAENERLKQKAADALEAKATQAQVTDEMVERALEAFMDEGEFCNMEYRQRSMRAALTAALQTEGKGR